MKIKSYKSHSIFIKDTNPLFDVIDEYAFLCKNLNVKGMNKNKRLSRSINDLGFYEFKRQLIYKANIYGKTVKELDRFYPSSKTCSCCGYKLEKLSLNVREWECPNCHAQHDRDINASINILNNADKIISKMT